MTMRSILWSRFHRAFAAVVVVLALPPPSPAQDTNTWLVLHSDTWNVLRGTNAPQPGWQLVATELNANWTPGAGGFGYADNSNETAEVRTPLADMKDLYSTFYVRTLFSVTETVATTNHLFLSMDWDDGYVAYLDGTEIHRRNAPGAAGTEPPYTATSTASHESSRGNNKPNPAVTNDLGEVGTRLPTGLHVLAVMTLNDSTNSSDAILIPDLYYGPLLPDPDAITITNDTTWYATNSPILVKGMVTCLGTLTLEPGVRVELQAKGGFVVTNQGGLIAEGTPTNPIVFTRASGTTRWHGIAIHGSTGAPETRIAYALIEYNTDIAIEVEAATVFLDHLTFGTTDRQYISIDNSSFVISDCMFPTMTAALEAVHGVGIKSGGRALFIRNFFGVVNGYSDTIDFTGGQRPGSIVQFIDNVFMGSGDDILDLDSTDAWVEGNLFLHIHKNGSPDTSSGISAGSGNADITILGNIFFDVDQAATAKEANFYTLINNTVAHQTHQGGFDTNGAVICLGEEGIPAGDGMYLEGNIFYDVEALVRDPSNAVITFTNNMMSLPWGGPGGGNTTNDPMFKHVPLLTETAFTNWAEAQVMWDWFSLLPGSPGIGTGPNGHDQGGAIPRGASVAGEPLGNTTQTVATLTVGANRTGNGITAAGWPSGSGYTHYRWRLDTNAWSAETPIATPIVLTNLTLGPHVVEITGKNDAKYYQDDPVFGPDAVVTTSRTWTVTNTLPPADIAIGAPLLTGTTVTLAFQAEASRSYSVLMVDSLFNTNWIRLSDVAAEVTNRLAIVIDPDIAGTPSRFYRVVTPARP